MLTGVDRENPMASDSVACFYLEVKIEAFFMCAKPLEKSSTNSTSPQITGKVSAAAPSQR